uniref:CSON011489 protein n=1 Tax=Culicoides sonorensis TaxID=179676 RepID=A0A336LGZ9_CULSO
MLGSNLVVPVVLWGPNTLTHCISSIYLTDDKKSIVTGSYDGQICIWQIDTDTNKMTPRYLLVGHTTSVLCICKASILPDYNYIVSSSESGEMCLWDLMDGKCLETVKIPQVHTSLQAYKMSGCDDIRLFCNGYYVEILIMDPFSLEILFSLTSKVNPDWISALHVLRPCKRKDDVVLAITTTGVVKVWTLVGNENKFSEPIYENESKQIRCLNAISMKCCANNQRTVLIVCAKYWQIYDAGDFTILCSVIAPTGERWMGGDFISSDRVLLYSDDGKGYVYRLPANSVPENKDFHKPSVNHDMPLLYCMLSQSVEKPLSCPPAIQLSTSESDSDLKLTLIKGDSEGNITFWNVPDHNLSDIKQIEDAKKGPLLVKSSFSTSLLEAWTALTPPAIGILDQLNEPKESIVKITASTYLPQQSRLVVGREDGSIIIVPATQVIAIHLLKGPHQLKGWPPHQVLTGHDGRVNCLLCPSLNDSRYDKAHLVSGGVDFSVCLWDLYSGNLLHRFCIHAGEITQLLAPPNSCSPRIQKCICSVASDHSVALLSLQERKCITLASRHLFPVTSIKWRPFDDFLIVGCSDGTVYIWQMETGHLDRVLHGMLAEEVLNACDEHSEELGGTGSLSDSDAESHILFFDIEGLIFELHSEEYAKMVQNTIEAAQKSEQHGSDAGKKISDFLGRVKAKTTDVEKILKEKDKHGILAKVKEGAENIQTKVQAKVESVVKNIGETNKANLTSLSRMETTHVMEVAQLILSLVHSWGLDSKLDSICETELGLLRPTVPISFGVLSKGGYMSLLLPTWQNSLMLNKVKYPALKTQNDLNTLFTSRLHWELSATMTSNHLLAMVALSNTLMSMNMASFLEKYRTMASFDEMNDKVLNQQQTQIKQGWSALSTHHCLTLPEKISNLDVKNYQKPQVEMMARRWQHHCIEIREAAQHLLLGELKRMGKKGRKQLVDSWSQFLPLYTHTEPIAPQNSNIQQQSGSTSPTGNEPNEEEFDDEDEEEIAIRKPSSLSELKRKQSTAVVLLGIIGAEFGQEISADVPQIKKTNEQRRASSTSEIFGGNNSLPRLTALALAHLVLAPATPKLPAFTPLRRAAIDLIGRGFTIWEPYLDVSKVLLGLLELCCDSHHLLPSLNYKLPLTPQADACRTARYSIRAIATARPAVFITTMAREVARYNAAQQNAQALSVPLTQTVLYRAKSEIHQCIEELIEKMQALVAGLLIEVTDIILHCVDMHDLKTKGLQEVCPALCKYNQVSHCSVSRRIATGAANGHLAVYELKQSKCQMIPAHSHPVTAIAFSPDGKFLASYSCEENKLAFWQTSTGMFGLGSSQTRCVKSYSTAPIPDVSRFNPMRLAKLIWISNKIVTLMLADGSETRFNI